MNDYTAMKIVSDMIQKNLAKTKAKGIKKLKEANALELAYQVLFCLEEAFGRNMPEKGWTAIKPMTNVACKVGLQILMQDEEGLDEKKRNTKRFKHGYQVLYALVEGGLIEFIKGKGKRDNYRIKVKKEQKQLFADLLSVIGQMDPLVKIHSMPQFEQPEPFTKFHHDVAGPIVRNINPKVIPSFTKEHMPKVFKAINEHMAIAYGINTDILEVYMQILEDDLFTFKHKDLDEEQLQGLDRERDKVLEIATLVGDRAFYEYMFYDYRGRMYSSTAYLSHAGCKLSKSLFLFDEKKPLTSDGWFWLMVHAANTFGFDKATIDARANFAEENLENWLTIAQDPVNNKEWQKADSPFEFLAAIMELNKADKSGDRFTYKSGLAVAWDASCSGLQVLSALAKDEVSGALCNLTSSEDRGDYYLMIADHVWKECVYTTEDEENFNTITNNLNFHDDAVKRAFKEGTKEEITAALQARKDHFMDNKKEIYAAGKVFWGRPEMAKLRRKVCKRPCMTYFYSCGEQTMSDAIMSDHGSDPEFAGLTSTYCFWLAKRVFSACKELMSVPTELMRLFIKLGLDDYKNGDDFSITGPYNNFELMQSYRNDIKMKVCVGYKGRIIRPIVTVGKGTKINRQKVLSGTSPNVVHMLDSQIVSAMLLTTEYTVSTIHDSFGSHACNAGKLFEDTREVFVELFKQDILTSLLNQKGIEHSDIAQGNLDLNEAYDNDYCFS